MREDKFRQKLMLEKMSSVQSKADTTFQLSRRMEESNKDGVCRCVSCGTIGHYKSFDAGHYIPRHHLGVRYEKTNVWPQCKKCNKWLSGNHAKYRDGLIKLIGKDGVEHLEANKDVMPFSIGTSWRDWCIETIVYHKKLIKLGHDKEGTF